jgi:uncharacterized protein (DUF58 family)
MAEPAATTSPDALLRRLEWTVVRRLDGLLQGDYRTLFRGSGVDLADLREYQHHDDVRHIDWNVTARLQTPYVRQFLEDRDLTAWFLLDLSGSVHFGSADVTKLAVSTGFVATLARVITRHGNRVGAVLYGSQVDAVLPPKSSRTHVLDLLQRMTQPRPAAPKASKANKADKAQAGAGTSLVDLLRTADGVMTRRSLVFVLSDFISQPGWQDALARLSRRHEVVAVRLWDPMEMALPDVGLVTVEDAETGEQLFIDAADPAYRERYAAIAEQQEAALIDDLARSGADVVELATDDDLLQALLRLSDLRRQRARRKSPRHAPAQLQRATALAAGPGASAGAAVPVAAAQEAQDHRPTGQRAGGQAGLGQRPRLAPPRAAAADADGHCRRPVRGGAAHGHHHLAAVRAHHHAGHGRERQHAGRRRQAQPPGGQPGSRQGLCHQPAARGEGGRGVLRRHRGRGAGAHHQS